MVTLESIKDYIQGLNQKEIVRILAAYFILFLLGIGFLLYRHSHALATVEQKMKILNKARKEIQQILTEYDHIKNKKIEVDALLGKDKDFYIQKYCQDTLNEANITTTAPLALVIQPWPNGYVEESVQINASQISMERLCNFLQALQKNNLVFVKNLDIVKVNVGDKKINITMIVATLKPVVEKTSSTK